MASCIQENPRLFALPLRFVCPQTKRQNDSEPPAYPPAPYGDVVMAVDGFREVIRSVRVVAGLVWSVFVMKHRVLFLELKDSVRRIQVTAEAIGLRPNLLIEEGKNEYGERTR